MTKELPIDDPFEDQEYSKDKDMIPVVGVRFRHSKTLWFDPRDSEPARGDKVIVRTERGTEIGECSQARWEVSKEDLPAPLKPVLRIASEEDLFTDKELQDEEFAAIPVFRDYIEKNKLDMKPADVEILFGREKMIFYFSAEERIDFRQLVRDLAAHFHCRIEMRQIGVRDEARMTGGIAHCGEVLCCSRLGGEFAPVSIKMAKDQGLPLNPSKISGTCGRLMCCLRYESEAYKDFNKRAPKKGAIIDTPRGGGKVIDRDALRETVDLQFRAEDGAKSGDTMKVPLDRMCCKDKRKSKGASKSGKKAGCGGCPCAIEPEVFAQLVEESKQVQVDAVSADGFDFRGLSSTQGTESAIDNGKKTAKRPKRSRRGGSKNNNKDAKPRQSAKEGEGSGSKRPRRRNKSRGGSRTSRNEVQDSTKSGSDAKPSQSKPKSRQRRNNKGAGQGSGQAGQQNNRPSRRNRSSKDAPAQVETRVPRRRRSQDS
jgi:cell fate regulator YaaT (PSP1 superfamily)